MSESNQCPECGAELPRGATEGLCPKCLMGAALEPSDEIVEEGSGSAYAATTPQTGGFVPPLPEELIPLFPQLEILELLGHGGMGAVYKARQTKLDRLVALKIIRPESADDPAFAERFMREARTLARLNHPNIVAVHDFGETDVRRGSPTPPNPLTEGLQEDQAANAIGEETSGRASGSVGDRPQLYYFVMEYVDGMNLRQLMQAGELQPEQTLELVPQICEALQFAHDEGIIHRDIKPENILVDSRGRVKIADFGLARLVASSPQDFTLTGTHQVMGTPRYMAPEQMEGSHSVDHRADIYSLGVVFYEMLTGEIPAGHFEPPSKKAQIDARLDEVVLRALAREPERRYQKAGDVRSDVEAITSTHSLVSQSGMESVSYPHGVSTILEQGVGRIVQGVRQGLFWKFLTNPATQGIVAMLLCIGGVVTIFIPWGLSRHYNASFSVSRYIYAYDSPWGSIAGIIFFTLALALFASTTLRKRPAWRPWIIMITGGVTLGYMAIFHENMLTKNVEELNSFYTASGLCIALMLVGAWDVRLLLAQWNTGPDHPVSPKEPKKKATKKEDDHTPHYGFTVPGIDDIGGYVVAHFSLLGYRVISEQPGEWVFQRGKKSAAVWEPSLHLLHTTLTVRSGPQPGGGCWVTCGWDVTTWGMAYLTRKDIAKLKAEGRELERLLLSDSSTGPKTKIAIDAERTDEFLQTVTPSPTSVTRLLNSDVDSQQEITPVRSHTTSPSNVDIMNLDLEMLRMQVRGPAGGLMLTGILALLFWIVQLSTVYLDYFARSFAFSNKVIFVIFAFCALAVLTASSVIIIGAVKMRAFKSYELSMAASILAIIPWSFAAVLGIPLGIWALRVLRREEIKAAFVRESLRPREPRSERTGFSRNAIVGMLLVPACVVSISLAMFAIAGPPASFYLAMFFGLPGLVIPFLTTFLGIVAIGDIRDSKGRLTGLGLAFIDAVFFPTLISNTLLIGVAVAVRSEGLPLGELLFFAVPIVIFADVMVLRRLWRKVTATEDELTKTGESTPIVESKEGKEEDKIDLPSVMFTASLLTVVFALIGWTMWITDSTLALYGLVVPWYFIGLIAKRVAKKEEDVSDETGFSFIYCLIVSLVLTGFGVWIGRSAWVLVSLVIMTCAFYKGMNDSDDEDEDQKVHEDDE